MGDDRPRDPSIKEETTSLNLLSDKESNGGKQSNTAVSTLGLGVTSKSSISCLSNKSERIKSSYRSKSSSKSLKRSRDDSG